MCMRRIYQPRNSVDHEVSNFQFNYNTDIMRNKPIKLILLYIILLPQTKHKLTVFDEYVHKLLTIANIA